MTCMVENKRINHLPL